MKSADGPDGYHAVQLGFGDVPARNSTMPLIGHAAKSGGAPLRHYREIRLKDATDKSPGDAVEVNVFEGVKFVRRHRHQQGQGQPPA